MSRLAPMICLIAAIVAGGCAPWLRPTTRESESSTLGHGSGNAFAPLRASLARLTNTDKKAQLPDWDWVTGVPQDAPRADLVPATVASEAVLRIFNHPPGLPAVSASPAMRIINVAGHDIRNCAD